ncbi:hypothetical protein CAEBREN_13670 [Caenorhabditis brenneri]|uniref:C-type lectin domain-containing protein n=1 Tax=Caenorhabditis brenneri TaxID=135651 RepID=G0P2P8_CAEBE|nr:hypothetical protein CAEBREN_13670 [Caenorhabditis brenneri]
MCEFWGGGSTYKPREGQKSLRGDTCSFTLPFASDTKESARMICEEYVPYHINEAVPGVPDTVCKAEATLVCKNGWIQNFGRCYKMWKEMMTRDDAGKHCEKEGATVAFMHREALPFRIKEYFTNVYQFWIDASIAITKDLIHDVENGNLLLAIDGYPYNLPNIALARVAPDVKAMVLCEYTPPMTQSESSYLLRKYGQVYFPTIETSQATYVRTASSLNRNINNPTADDDYCTRVLKPFIPDGKAQSAIPTQEFMNKLVEMRAGGAAIVRTSAFSGNANDKDRKSKSCVNYDKNSLFRMYSKDMKGKYLTIDSSNWKKNEPNEQCDAATYSSGIVLSREGKPGLEAMSDARYAPLYCQSVVSEYKYGGCPDGFKEFHRKQLGQKWCHMFIGNNMKNYADAQAHCQTMGAWLSGYSSQEELDFMDQLITVDGDTLIGARRRDQCSRFGTDYSRGYDEDPSSPCSRKWVFEWKNGVAPNPPDFEPNWAHAVEPNHGTYDEECLIVMKGIRPYIGSNQFNGDKKLNDHRCSDEFNFFCGMEALIVVVN